MTAIRQETFIRDVQVAKDIGVLSDLGKFPKEVIVYGLVYYKDHERQYMISTNQGNLINFINDVENHQYYPTPISTYSERLLIPAGYEEDIVNQIKLTLAQRLQKDYPLTLFQWLDQLAMVSPNHDLEKTLWDCCIDLEGVFQVDKINAFSAICTNAFIRKNIDQHCYYRLSQWYQKRLSQLEAHIPPIGRREKSFYGFAAISNKQMVSTYVNANLSYIYTKQLALTQQGYLTTCWHKKTYDLDQFNNLPHVCKQMELDLMAIYDESLLTLIDQVNQGAVAIDQKQYHDFLAQLEVNEKAYELFHYYGRLWGVQ